MPKPTEPRKVTATWAGPDRYFPSLARTVTAGDQVEVWDHQVNGNPDLQPVTKSTKPKSGTDTEE